jgi:hypothetical protein
MRSIANIVIFLILLVGTRTHIARADGGRLALVERRGGLQFSVFTSPNPLRTGPVDISVLVQDAETDEPVSDAQVFMSLTLRENPERKIRTTATSAAATNKLMLSALVDLPEPGWWEVEVVCRTDDGDTQVQFATEAGRPLPRWLAVWPWFSWPLGAVLLFGVHRLLVWRRQFDVRRSILCA